MDKDDDIRRHASPEGEQADRSGRPDGFMRRWQPLRAHLSPLIGENGFSALFGRAVSLAAPQYGCLALDPAPKASEQFFAALEQNLSKADPATARAAETALMDAFTRQLNALIGSALTERLLAASGHGKDGQDKDRSTTK
jgi:hypothetical protein